MFSLLSKQAACFTRVNGQQLTIRLLSFRPSSPSFSVLVLLTECIHSPLACAQVYVTRSIHPVEVGEPLEPFGGLKDKSELLTRNTRERLGRENRTECGMVAAVIICSRRGSEARNMEGRPEFVTEKQVCKRLTAGFETNTVTARDAERRHGT